MKRIIMFVAVAATVCSCTFVRVGGGCVEKILNSTLEGGTGLKDLEKLDSSLADLSELMINVPVNLTYSQSDEPSVNIEAEDVEDLDNLKITCKGGKLTLAPVDVKKKNKGSFNVTLSTPELSSVELNGAGVIDLKGHFKTEKFRIEINGAGKCEIEDMECSVFDAELNGAGEIKAAGYADKSQVEINGVGKVDIKGLTVNDLTKRFNGLGTLVQ